MYSCQSQIVFRLCCFVHCVTCNKILRQRELSLIYAYTVFRSKITINKKTYWFCMNVICSQFISRFPKFTEMAEIFIWRNWIWSISSYQDGEHIIWDGKFYHWSPGENVSIVSRSARNPYVQWRSMSENGKKKRDKIL